MIHQSRKPDKPVKPVDTDKAPQTSDSNNPYAYLILGSMAFVGIILNRKLARDRAGK